MKDDINEITMLQSKELKVKRDPITKQKKPKQMCFNLKTSTQLVFLLLSETLFQSLGTPYKRQTEIYKIVF